MSPQELVFANIRTVLAQVSDCHKNRELRLQIIKYGAQLRHTEPEVFCKAMGLSLSHGAELLELCQLTSHLVQSGLDISQL